MRGLWLVGLVMCVACGGSASDDGSGGTAGSGNGGSAGSGADGGTSAGGNGGSSGNAGSSGSGQGGDAPTPCMGPSDCVVVPISCCGQCGAATRGDAQALHKNDVAIQRTWTCGDTGCPDCYMATDPNLLATCTAGKCALVDLQTTSATECTQNSDCRLRTNECCECGGAQDPEHLVAVSDYSIEQLVCDPGSGCPECAPAPPDYAEAVCDAGRCSVQWLLGNN